MAQTTLQRRDDGAGASVRIEVDAYKEFAVDAGTRAEAMACLRLTVNGSTQSAAALAPDTTGAMLQAVLTAIGRGVGSKGWRGMKAEVA